MKIKNLKLKIRLQGFTLISAGRLARLKSSQGRSSDINVRPSGFTLIEILVALTIIAIIGGIGLAGYGKAQENARDARRKRDLFALKGALVSYYQDSGYYPPCTPPCTGTGFDYFASDSANPWIQGLIDPPNPYIKKIPKDPKQAGGITNLANLIFNKDQEKNLGQVASSHITTLDKQVASSADDAYQNDSGFGFNRFSTSLAMYSHTTDSSRYNTGLRFTNITIPNGATITSAYIEINVIDVLQDDANVDIAGEDTDNALDFEANEHVTSRTRTTAKIAWVQDGLGTGFKKSPNINSVIQEIVERPGWSSGNALVILVDGKDDANRYLAGYSYYNNAANAPRLHIEYTVPSALPPPGASVCDGKQFIYCYAVPKIRDSFVLWAQLENKNDTETVLKPDASCTRTDWPAPNFNYCLESPQ